MLKILNIKIKVKFYNDHNIILRNYTTYYPRGNELKKYSNNSLVRITKKLLQENMKYWHTKLIYALWDDRFGIKSTIGTSCFQLVYGTQVFFPTFLGIPIMKFLQEDETEPNHVQRRINKLI